MTKMFYVSRIYNRIVFFFISMFMKMIWDYTGKNKDILDDMHDYNYVKDVMTFIAVRNKKNER